MYLIVQALRTVVGTWRSCRCYRIVAIGRPGNQPGMVEFVELNEKMTKEETKSLDDKSFQIQLHEKSRNLFIR